MEQILLWIADNIVGALLSVCLGALLGIGGTSYYYRNKYSVKNKQTQKGGNNSTNIQINGDNNRYNR